MSFFGALGCPGRPELEHVSGVYFVKMKRAKPSAGALDATAAQRLWAKREEMTGIPVRQVKGLRGTMQHNRAKRPPYKTFLVSADGHRTLVEAHSIIIELAKGDEMELFLAPPAARKGGVCIRTGPPPSRNPDPRSFRCLSVHPGASNVIHVYIERFARKTPGKRSRRA